MHAAKDVIVRIFIDCCSCVLLTFSGSGAVLPSSSTAWALSLLPAPLSWSSIFLSPISSFLAPPAAPPTSPTPNSKPPFGTRCSSGFATAAATVSLTGGGCWLLPSCNRFSLILGNTSTAAAALLLLLVLVAMASPSGSIGHNTSFCCFARPLRTPLRSSGIVHRSRIILPSKPQIDTKIPLINQQERQIPSLLLQPHLTELNCDQLKTDKFATLERRFERNRKRAVEREIQ